MPGPLEGMKVVDVTHVMAGAFCSMQLADMGADVVKVERPTGDETRVFGGGGGFSPFVAVNRNKRSIAVDLQKAAGAEIVRDMARRADVFVENYRRGTMDKLGLGYDELSALNPRLVYCSVSGFGATGPYATRGGFDLVAQGMSGIMSFTGEPGRPPVKVGVPIADLNAGLFGAYGIVNALLHRERTGEGQFVDTSLLEGAIAYTCWESAIWFGTGRVAEPTGSAHRLSAPYEAFRTQDGWLNLGAANQSTWEKLCGALARGDLQDDERFAQPGARLRNRAELAVVLQEVFERDTTAAWMTRLEAAGVPCGPIYTIDQVFDDEHVRARDMVVETHHPLTGPANNIGVPVKLSRSPGGVVRAAPVLGEHTVEVLAELGRSSEDIRRLRDDSVVEQADLAV